MTTINITLPTLTEAQARILDGKKRHVVVVGGEKSGKTTLGVDALLAWPRGALSGGAVAYVSPTKDLAAEAMRAMVRLLGAGVRGSKPGRRIELGLGGSIDFFGADEATPPGGPYTIAFVDDARHIADLSALMSDIVLPALQRKAGRAVVASGAYGKNNAFYRFMSEVGGDPDWAPWRLPSTSNPHLPAETRRLMGEVTPQEYEQRFGAVFHEVSLELTAAHRLIGPGETFRGWCERLAATGMKVDGRPFRLNDRPAMAWIYDQIPSTREEANNYVLVIMKCAQVGFTIMEILAALYMGIKFGPSTVGMFLPSQSLANIKSTHRFMPIVRSVPDVHAAMTMDAADGSGSKSGEGNVQTRRIAHALFVFSWTSGRATTESIPMDSLMFDEVQEMTLEQMEKTRERLSGSYVKFTLMGSTANWPDSDIHHWYKLGSQYQFHTRCPDCGAAKPLDDYFPRCIGWDDVLNKHRYVCDDCGGWIDDPQDGEWRPLTPEAEDGGVVRIRSIHFPQMLSPTISPSEIMAAYNSATSMKNFYNRKLGKPWADPNQIPVNLEILNDCARLGVEAGLVWRRSARQTFMGVDQMGNFNVVIIKERMADGRQAVVHLEYIYTKQTVDNPNVSPFDRCSELMDIYGVQICVVETLPNYNEAKSFAHRHPGRVFLASYGQKTGEMISWGDALRENYSERRTEEEAQDPWTVSLDQYKCMQVSMARFVRRRCLFPDPDALQQDIIEKGVTRRAAVCRELAFLHFTKTALVVGDDDEGEGEGKKSKQKEKKFRPKVVKVGIDPHTSYANMLCDVAWARAHGTGSFIMPDAEEPSLNIVRSGGVAKIDALAAHHAEALLGMLAPPSPSQTCGGCSAFDPENDRCRERGFGVRAKDAACSLFMSSGGPA